MAKKYKFVKTISVDGHKYKIRADSESELAVKEYKKRQELESGRKIISNNTLVKDWVNTCIETYKPNLDGRSLYNYKNMIDNSILREIGNMRLKDVKPVHCQAILKKLDGYSASYLKKIEQALKFIFSKAVDNDLLSVSPARGLIRPQGTVDHRRALTAIERKYVLQVAYSNRRFYIYLLMMLCGCRPSEAAECQGRDIKIIDDIPTLHIRGTKTVNANRVVPIPTELYSAIRATKKLEYISCTPDGHKLDETRRHRTWKAFKRELNITMGCKVYRSQLIPPFPLAEDLVPYCFRHEYCTELARKNISLSIAKSLMGHSDISLTANIYTNIIQDDYLKSVSKIINS